MPFKDGCVFNEETKEKIYNIFRGSNLEVLEFVHEILPNDETISDALKRYCDLSEYEDENEMSDIFWEVMDYLRLTDYIFKREREI